MLLAHLQFTAYISWKFSAHDPSLFALSETKEWSLVNPLLYRHLAHAKSEIHCDEMSSGKYFVMTQEIVLATEDEQALKAFDRNQTKIGVLPLNLGEILERLVVRLRHAGGQATVPDFGSLMFCRLHEITNLPVIASSEMSLDKNTTVQEYWWRTALTAEQLGATTQPDSSFTPPTHEVIFLDAVAAHRRQDFRQTILYSAMATEIAFGTVIDRAYERIIAGPNDGRFRVIARPQAGGPSVLKDPVYEQLRGRSRSNFHVLIDELAVYTLCRSLLVENEGLYQRAKRLHTTRNKLAHTGVVDDNESNENYPIDEGGAMAALKTASDLFSWLGERADFPLPKRSFVKIADGEARSL